MPRIDGRRRFAGSFAIGPAGAACGDVIHYDGRSGAWAPVAAGVVVECRVDELQRRSVTIRRRGPRCRAAEVHAVHFIARLIAQNDVLAVAVEPAGPRPERGDAVQREHRRGVRSDHEVAAGCDGRAIWKNVVHSAIEAPSGHVHCGGGRVVEFDEFRELRVARGVVVQLVNFDVQVRRGDGKCEHFIERVSGAVGDANAHADGLPEIAAEVVCGNELRAVDREVSVVRIARARDEREGQCVAGIRVHRLQVSDEAAVARSSANQCVVRDEIRRRERRRNHGDGNRRDVRSVGCIARGEGKRIRAVVACRGSVGQIRRCAGKRAVKRVRNGVGERGECRVRIRRAERDWKRSLIRCGDRRIIRDGRGAVDVDEDVCAVRSARAIVRSEDERRRADKARCRGESEVRRGAGERSVGGRRVVVSETAKRRIRVRRRERDGRRGVLENRDA